jgi:hypothetical protein
MNEARDFSQLINRNSGEVLVDMKETRDFAQLTQEEMLDTYGGWFGFSPFSFGYGMIQNPYSTVGYGQTGASSYMSPMSVSTNTAGTQSMLGMSSIMPSLLTSMFSMPTAQPQQTAVQSGVQSGAQSMSSALTSAMTSAITSSMSSLISSGISSLFRGLF